MLKFVVILSVLATLFLVPNTNGLLFHHKDKCPVQVIKGGKEFSGEKIMGDKQFAPFVKSIATVAKGCKVRVHVVDSFKQLKTPTEYVLSSQMPLALGRGIHFDLKDPKGATLCNKLCMTTRSWKSLPEAACFIDNIQKKGLKFTEPNLLDDGHAAKIGTAQAETLKVATQKLCAPKTAGTNG
jgi:hypothetical protein